MKQWIRIDGLWTERLPGESITDWIGRAPTRGEPAPDEECDHEDEWTSGGKVYLLCTVCADDENVEGACKDRHEEALAGWQQQYPVDP